MIKTGARPRQAGGDCLQSRTGIGLHLSATLADAGRCWCSDNMMSCYQINAEIAANNQKVQDLARERGWKIAQNVAAGVAGIVIWPLWFGMDFQGAAATEARAPQERQQYLARLAAQKHCQNPIRPN